MKEEALIPIPQEISPPKAPVNAFKKSLILGSLIIFLLLIIGVYFLNRQLKTELPPQPSPITTELVSPIPTIEIKAAQRPNTQEDFYYQIGQNIKRLFE